MSKNTFTANLFPMGEQFGANFFIKATIEVTDFGSPEVGRSYMADPTNYDPGSAPEWSCAGVELFYDCSGPDGERVGIGEKLAEVLREFVEDDDDLIVQVEAAISEFASEDADC